MFDQHIAGMSSFIIRHLSGTYQLLPSQIIFMWKVFLFHNSFVFIAYIFNSLHTIPQDMKKIKGVVVKESVLDAILYNLAKEKEKGEDRVAPFLDS
jgi:hypothetical protein